MTNWDPSQQAYEDIEKKLMSLRGLIPREKCLDEAVRALGEAGAALGVADCRERLVHAAALIVGLIRDADDAAARIGPPDDFVKVVGREARLYEKIFPYCQ